MERSLRLFIGVVRGALLEHRVILCFERRYAKKNIVIRLKSNILAPQYFPQNFWAGYATEIVCLKKNFN